MDQNSWISLKRCYQVDEGRVTALIGDGRAQPQVLLRLRGFPLGQVVDVEVVLREVAFRRIPEDLNLAAALNVRGLSSVHMVPLY